MLPLSNPTPEQATHWTFPADVLHHPRCLPPCPYLATHLHTTVTRPKSRRAGARNSVSRFSPCSLKFTLKAALGAEQALSRGESGREGGKLEESGRGREGGELEERGRGRGYGGQYGGAC
jgi:hypothetical protein